MLLIVEKVAIRICDPFARQPAERLCENVEVEPRENFANRSTTTDDDAPIGSNANDFFD